MWVSDCQFLNDGTELAYAREIFFTEVQKLSLAPVEDGGGGHVLAGQSLDEFRVFITCFCEDRDLLSQWRGYGTDQGYAMGFDIDELRALNFGEITPVQYGITNPSEYFGQELKRAHSFSAHPGMAEYFASEHLLPRLARVKHPSFAEEREWRVLKQVPLHVLNDPNVSVKFRSSAMGPLAYLVMSFPPECLREIVIGPGSHAETRKAAVLSMLHYYNLKHVNVITSTTPFRT